MRVLEISEKTDRKIHFGNRDLFEIDFDDLPRSIIVGEWVYLNCSSQQRAYLAFVNLHATSGAKVRVALKVKDWKATDEESSTALKTIKDLIIRAIEYRKKIGSRDSHRIVFGAIDGLPGLIADKYENVVIVQINSAGIDRFREEIRVILKLEFNCEVVLFDREEYRKSEVLPVYEKDKMPETVKVVEDNFTYSLPASIWQKTGFYFDHRENRKKLESSIKNSQIDLTSGLDLYSYVGSWGLHLLRGGVQHVTFVDQGNLQDAIESSLKTNGLQGRGDFVRGDVFNVLDQLKEAQKKFNVIVCDPPAFSKTADQRKSALMGYEKLYRKMIPLLQSNSYAILASCTHGVSFENMCEMWSRSCHNEGREFRLVDIGLQGGDHPFENFESREHYLKYLLFYVF